MIGYTLALPVRLMATKLEKFAAKQCCLICKEKHTDELIYGAVYKLGQITVHYFCLLLSTDMVQQGKDEEGILGFLPQDIQSTAKTSATVSCTICQRGGATVRCMKCSAMFHLPCGIRHGSSHQFYGQFKSFCPQHRIQQAIPKHVLVDMPCSVCSICLENVELASVIWAPCCKKNGLFHRSCLQRMAYSFGSYALKCPLCNNRKKFLQAVKNHGIYIPQQDASWEIEPNAFIELLERNQHCYAKKCICPKGRKYSQDSSESSANWKVLVCADCGSQGVHYKCLAAGTSFKWKCDVCRNIESALKKRRVIESSSPSVKTSHSGVDKSELDDGSGVTINEDHRNIFNANLDADEDHKIPINSSNTTSKVELHSNVFNRNSNKSTTDTEEEQLVKRRRIDTSNIDTAPKSEPIRPEEIKSFERERIENRVPTTVTSGLGNRRTLLKTGQKSFRSRNQPIPQHYLPVLFFILLLIASTAYGVCMSYSIRSFSVAVDFCQMLYSATALTSD